MAPSMAKLSGVAPAIAGARQSSGHRASRVAIRSPAAVSTGKAVLRGHPSETRRHGQAGSNDGNYEPETADGAKEAQKLASQPNREDPKCLIALM
jgi:hypothetical protein